MATVAGPDTVTAADETAAARRRWPRITVSITAIAAVVALAVAAAQVAVTHAQDRAREAHRADLVDAARTGVLALIDVHVDTADATLARLRDLSTGQFADELSDNESGLAAAIRDAKVDSSGRIDSAALAEEGGTSGVVLVAASGEVANAGSPDATARTYRLRVTLDEVDGSLLMSKVEFVP
ncbi:hypothetical protein ACFYVR_03290 [Rhodococcus sp. NPDC003318]|uniref:hypothetical protein n=1 Tax=Rhodococcus sp. NPDC003318 TaxID=3364503 RepID=UPI0036BA1CFE